MVAIKKEFSPKLRNRWTDGVSVAAKCVISNIVHRHRAHKHPIYGHCYRIRNGHLGRARLLVSIKKIHISFRIAFIIAIDEDDDDHYGNDK